MLAAVVLAACHSDTRQAPTTIHPPSATRSAVDLSDPLALVPANSDLVVMLDLAALRRSPLWTPLAHDAFAIVAPGLAADCNYNPLDQITVIAGGFVDDYTDSPFVVRGIDRDATLACLKTSKTETVTAVEVGADGIITATNKSGAVNLGRFTDAKTLVIFGSKHPTKEGFTAALTIGAPLRRDTDFVATFDRTSRGAALAMIVRHGAPTLHKMTAKFGAEVRAMEASISLTDHLEAHVRIELASPEVAASTVDAVRPQIQAYRRYVDRVDVHAEGDTFVVDASISEAQLQTFVGMLKAAWAQQQGS